LFGEVEEEDLPAIVQNEQLNLNNEIEDDEEEEVGNESSE